MSKPKPPDTISDQKWADLRRRAEKAAPPMFSRRAVNARIKGNEQRDKKGLS